jgi:hypothetical protein
VGTAAAEERAQEGVRDVVLAGGGHGEGWFAGGGGERRGGGRSSASWSSLRVVIKRERRGGEERWNIRLRLPGEKDLRTTGLRPGTISHLVQLFLGKLQIYPSVRTYQRSFPQNETAD